MKYFFVVFGCQMNHSDAERMRTVLEKIGYKSASTLKEADLLIVNMCSIRQSAVDRVYGLIPKIRQQKKANPQFRSLLTGCVLQSDRRKLRSEFDFILNTQDLANWPEKLGFPEKNIPINHYLEIEPTYQSPFTAFVPIMTGCNYQCTYCIVPTTRHREYYRPAKEILQEVEELAKKGYQEIWLLGQNVNHYSSNLNSQPIDFSKLLELIEKIEGNFWLYFTSPYPSDFNNRLIEVIAQSKKLAPYLNLPLQSGDNAILQKMNRHYTVEEYLNLVNKTRKAFKKSRKELEKYPAISTDVIVGFPGETKKAFRKTVKIFKKLKFEAGHIASFSPRPGTIALQLKNKVAEPEKERRKKQLTKVLSQTALKENKKYLHHTIPVLIERVDSQKNFLLGRSFSYKAVKIFGLSNKKFIGKKIPVKINKVSPWQLEGKIPSLP